MDLYNDQNAIDNAIDRLDHFLSSIDSPSGSGDTWIGASMDSSSPATWRDSNHPSSHLFYDGAAGSIAANSSQLHHHYQQTVALEQDGTKGAGSKRSSNSSSSSSSAAKFSTDPQSVAARMRRKRISERFKTLQRLVPGGSKMDTASMLDEAITYVKFLKHQIWLHEIAIATNGGSSDTNAAGGFLSSLLNSSSSADIHGRSPPPQLWN